MIPLAVCLKSKRRLFQPLKKASFILCLSLLIILPPLPQTLAKTTSVVSFQSKYGLILINSIRSRAAFDLFESLNVPVKNGVFVQTKIFAPKDNTFRIICNAYGANHVCAIMVYPGKFASLNFETDEISLSLPASYAKKYANRFAKDKSSFTLRTEDRRLLIYWSKMGLRIKNFRFKGDRARPKPFKEWEKPVIPGVNL